MKKFFVAALASALLGAAGFCAEYSEYENWLVEQALQIRLESRMKKSAKEAFDWISEKREEFFSSIDKKKVSEEAALALENIFVLEQHHYLWEIDSDAKETNDFILAQCDKVTNWNASRPVETRGDWYNLSGYEVINAAMPLFKYSKKISFGMEEKKLYDSMIQAKSKIGVLYINAGLWYAFAPAIGGGSNSKAKDYFAFAAKNGPSAYEKFFGLVYLSQMDIKQGDKDSWQKHLEEADSILPGNAYTPFARAVNKAGSDVFEYANDKAGVLAKLKKSGGTK